MTGARSGLRASGGKGIAKNTAREVAQRYGVPRWQLSTWRSLARAGKLAVPRMGQGQSVDAAPEASGAFAALQVEPALGPGLMKSVVLEARAVKVRVQGEVQGVVRGSGLAPDAPTSGTPKENSRGMTPPRTVAWRSGPEPLHRFQGPHPRLRPAPPRRDESSAVSAPWRADVRPAGAMLVLEFLVLTAACSGEVRNARWEQVDRDGTVWTIPAERMKAGKEHRVPLSP